jgi:hypothetical protein
MCRIVVSKNPQISTSQMQELFSFLIRDSGGDGCGLSIVEKDKKHIESIKNARWGEDYAPWLAELYMKFVKSDELALPPVFHTRKASVGGVKSEKNHPIAFGESHDDGLWITKKIHGMETLYSESVGAVFHNGTIAKDRMWLVRMLTKVAVPDLSAWKIANMSDTQMMACLIDKMDDFDVPMLIPDFGVLVTMTITEGGPEILIHRTIARTLYMLQWEPDQYIVASNLPPEFAKMGTIYRIPEGAYSLRDIVEGNHEIRPMLEQDAVREFDKKFVAGTVHGAHNHSYHQKGWDD